MKKVLLYVVLSLVVVVASGFAFLALKSPDMREAPNLNAPRTPERAAHGKYLFHMAGCANCHSVVIADRFGEPIVPGGLAKGKVLPAEMELPGKVTAPNLTSDKETGSGSWTDGQIMRAIREGIGHDGRTLLPFMPYTEYRFMSDEDIESIIAFLRSTEPVKNDLPKTEVAFPVSLMIKFSPKPVVSVPSPDKTNPVAFGKYLTKVYACIFCHSPDVNHVVDETRLLAGGHVFGSDKRMKVVTPNLTPDVDTGTGSWTEQQFLDKFRQYKDYAEKGSPAMTAENFTIMPWLYAANMDEVELKAIYAYLRTVPPINNAVVTRPNVK